MNTETKPTAEQVAQVTLDRVGVVYSGTPGCMCGCRGKYTTASAHKAWRAKQIGSPVEALEDVNDRTVALLTKKVLAAPLDELTLFLREDGTGYLVWDRPQRTYALYLAK